MHKHPKCARWMMIFFIIIIIIIIIFTLQLRQACGLHE
jgi:hypothetical protein